MVAAKSDVMRSRDAQLVSPELVLVDPVLAARARSELELAPVGLSDDGNGVRPRQEPRAHPWSATPSTSSALDLSGRVNDRLRALGLPRAIRHREVGRHGLFIAAVASAAVAVLVGAYTTWRSPASVDRTTAQTTTPGPSDVTNGQTRKPPPIHPTAGGRSKPRARNFAWAPTPGASAYRMELFKGGTRIFSTETRATQVTVPARWRYDNEVRSLDPGGYRWLVWPIVSGVRAARAIVQSTLVVSSS
jgi:hypothetical protein